MTTLKKIFGVCTLAMFLLLAYPNNSNAQGGNYISDQEFYDDLQPYGTWIDDPQYGNVWVPNVDENFKPYATRGHWVLTDYGNTWVSDYPWGWATFHYGRWRYDDYYGWEWLPGHEWAPAWVSWRQGGGYYGWAPLLPGISISLSIGRSYTVPDNYWVCAPQAYINQPNIYNYYAPPSRSVTIIRNTTVINNTYVNNNVTYITGPRPQEIRQVTHQGVRVYNINNASRPGNVTVNNNTVNIYRPAVNKAPDARPARVVDANAYRQQHPNQAIANRGNGGAPAFNHANAARLAMVAKAPTPDNNVVHVNTVNNRPNNQPGQPAVTRQGMPNNPNGRQQPQPGFGQRQQPTQQTQQQQAPQQAQQQQRQQQPAAQQAQQQQRQQQQAMQQQRQQQQAARQAQPQQRQQQQAQQQQRQQQQAAQQAQQQQRQQQQAAQQAQQQQRQQQQAMQQQRQQQQAAQQAQQQQRQQQQAAQQAQQRQQQQAAQQAQQQQRQQQQAAQQAQQQQRQQQQAAQQAQQQQRQQQQAAQQAQQQQRQQQQAAQQQQRQQQQAAQQQQRQQQQQQRQQQQQQQSPRPPVNPQ